MKKFVFAFAFLFAICSGAKAQAPFFSLDTATTGLNFLGDTVLANSTVSVPVTIRNTGNGPFFGDIAIYIGVVDSFGVVDTVTTYLDSIGDQNNFFNPGDTANFVVSANIDMNVYKLEGNTTVIWPAAPDVDYDSIVGDVWVIEAMNIGFITGANNYEVPAVKLYPNPVLETLYIQVEDGSEPPISLRMFDLNGRLLYEARNQSSIPVRELNLNAGAYLIELTLENQMTFTYKVLKQP